VFGVHHGRAELTMRGLEIKVGFRYTYRTPGNAEARGQVWSAGPVTGSWWVKPEHDPAHPVAVKTREFTGQVGGFK
jgi:hypothetical protein